MSTTTQDNPALRHFRNTIIIAILIVFILALCFYITGTLVIVSINGSWTVIKAYSALPIDQQFIYLYKTMAAYWKFYFSNYTRLQTSSYNYFTTKLWLTTLLPYAFLVIFGWIFRAPLMDWRPFKKQE